MTSLSISLNAAIGSRGGSAVMRALPGYGTADAPPRRSVGHEGPRFVTFEEAAADFRARFPFAGLARPSSVGAAG